ncbi:rod shape-determining protein RodA [Blattabacterium cuenoti]|uniref:rod shape-determining protein RodA n=1 Tax=Blattabacterium cuenoti TaxID=1653831 RepID=UPI001EEAFAFE|nr:rod shape-determining protein RodA [Blattabacterium cuenoti]
MNLYSVSYEKAEKQLVWILFSFICIFLVFLLKPIHYKYFSSFFFLFTLLFLIGVFFFGKNVNGSKSWYVFGPISFQPSELAKISTSLMISKILSQKNVKKNKNIFISIFLIILPSLLIFLQPDPGSSLVFFSFIFTLYRQGLSIFFLLCVLFLIFLFVISFNISYWIIIFCIFSVFLFFFLVKKRSINDLLFYLFLLIFLSTFVIISPLFFNKFLKQHHKDRINILFQNEFDRKYRDNVGYNLLYSKTAIGSGKFFGKGYQKGTITKGKFVPEQHTDYIFCTVGEEWGFVGSVTLIIFYLLFISRIYFLSEKQKDVFGRIFGYSVGNILFIHFFINLSMVMGLFPTIGIVLPFFSYGGSSFFSFTVLLFIFIRLDASDQDSLI